jgi:ribose 5-phosphate isomerase B
VRVAFGTDEVTAATSRWVSFLAAAGHKVDELAAGDPWPDVGAQVAAAVAAGRAERGVVCCWTGTGVSIAANKVPGVRAALCTDAATAAGARRYNDANVLALGLRLTTAEVGCEILEAFLATPVEASELGLIGRLETPAVGAAGLPSVATVRPARG